MQAVGQRDDGRHDGAVFRAVFQVLDEGTVDLDLFHGEALQVGQAGIAGAEIVDRQAQAHAIDLPQNLQRMLAVLHQRRLGDLEFQQRRIDARFPQHGADGRHQALVHELARRQIHRQGHGLQALALPGHALLARLAHDPFAHRHDQAVFLHDGNEAVRQHQAMAGTAPAQQHFHAMQAARGDIDDGLVKQFELLQRQRRAQAAFQVEVQGRRLVHRLREELVIIAAIALGVVHGRIGMAHQGVDIAAIVRIQADADRRRDVQHVAVERKGGRQRLDDLLGHARRFVGVADARHQHDEFIAAQARHRVAGAHRAAQPGSHFLEQHVARHVAQRIVDGLETVQVDEHHGQLAPGALRGQHGPFQPVRQQRAVRQARQVVVVSHVMHARLGLAPLGDLALQQQIGAGQFSRAFVHAQFQFVARAAHRLGRLAARRHVVDQPHGTAMRMRQVERPAGQARPEAAAILAHQLVFRHVHPAGREIARRLAACRLPRGHVRIQGLHRQAVDLAGSIAEQLFHLAVGAQIVAALHHRDAQHGAVEDGLVFQQRIAQGFFGALRFRAVLDDPDGAGGGIVRIDDIGDQLRPQGRAVAAHHFHFRLKRLGHRQEREGRRAEQLVGLLRHVQRAPGQAQRLVAAVAEHCGKAQVVARDLAVLGIQDAHRGIRHDGRHFHLRLAAVRDVFEYPDGALLAMLLVDGLGADAAPEQAAIAAAEQHFILLVRQALPQQWPGLHAKRCVGGG